MTLSHRMELGLDLAHRSITRATTTVILHLLLSL